MKMYAINGSPRKKWNTAQILEHVLEGAKKEGMETEIVHLYDLKYTGCVSCFACKRINGPSYGKCAIKDDLGKLLPQLLEADALVFGSPVYFGDITGMMRCFLERLMFPNFVYAPGYPSLAPTIRSAFVYTMNVPTAAMDEMRYPERLAVMEKFAARLFNSEPRLLHVCNTVQFDDYSKYLSEIFSPEEKKKYHDEHFHILCRDAEEIGGAMAREIKGRQN